MSRRFATLALLILTTVSGCSTEVKLQYQQPAANTFADVAKQANDQYRYVQLATLYVRVAPADTTASEKPDKTDQFNKPQKPATPSAAAAQGASPTPSGAAGRASTPTAEHDAATSSKKAVSTPSPQKPAAPPSKPGGSPTPTPTPSTPSPPSPPKLDPALATTLIDGKKWTAAVVPMPDETHAFMVRGVSGFWKTTSISVARYDNSDLASSVTSKAENLVAKRLGQFAGVAASMVSIAGGLGLGVDSAGNQPTKPLLPFSIKVPENGPSIGTLNDGWSYRFDYDSDTLPAGTVSFDAFLAGVLGQTVSYWPVMACRTATVTVIPPKKETLGYQYSFNVVVASAAALRLQPVPIDGKLNPGAVCSASESGTTTADPVQTFADDLSALQQGIQKVKDAKTGKSTPASGTSPPAATPAATPPASHP